MNKFKKGEGFTLIEMVVVFAIIAIIMSFGLPLGLDSYRNYMLTSEVRTLVSLLRRAESLALANIYEKSHGVAIQDDKFIVFQGAAFATRDSSYDEIYWRSKNISISGPFLEFVFAPISSLTNNSSTITLTGGIKSQTVGVNGYGAINW